MELATIVLCVSEVNLRDLAKEVQELRILKFVHAFTVSHRVDHSHQTLSEDHTKYLIRHIQL